MKNLFGKIKTLFTKHKLAAGVTVALLLGGVIVLLMKIRGTSSTSNAGQSLISQPTAGYGSQAGSSGQTQSTSPDSLIENITGLFKKQQDTIDTLTKSQTQLEDNQAATEATNKSWFSSVLETLKSNTADLSSRISNAVTSIPQQVQSVVSQSVQQATPEIVKQSVEQAAIYQTSSKINEADSFLTTAKNTIANAAQNFYADSANKDYYHKSAQDTRAAAVNYIQQLSPSLGYSVNMVDSGQGYKNVVITDSNGVQTKL